MNTAIGESRAKQMILFGEEISSSTALEWGLVSRVSGFWAQRRATLDEFNRKGSYAFFLGKFGERAIMFFTIDLGRPLHVFDADKVAGGVLTLRRGADEEFAGLHGKPVRVGAEDCVIADANGVQSLAGIVGGEATGCDAGTTNVFIECALFDHVRIAQTGQRHGIFSDARQRFERGIDSQLLPVALDAATTMLLELCGGQPSEITQAGVRPAWNAVYPLTWCPSEPLAENVLPYLGPYTWKFCTSTTSTRMPHDTPVE